VAAAVAAAAAAAAARLHVAGALHQFMQRCVPVVRRLLFLISKQKKNETPLLFQLADKG